MAHEGKTCIHERRPNTYHACSWIHSVKTTTMTRDQRETPGDHEIEQHLIASPESFAGACPKLAFGGLEAPTSSISSGPWPCG